MPLGKKGARVMRREENLAVDLFEQIDSEKETEETNLAARWIPVALKEVMRNAEEEGSLKL